jgi:hypothetical protein
MRESMELEDGSDGICVASLIYKTIYVSFGPLWAPPGKVGECSTLHDPRFHLSFLLVVTFSSQFCVANTGTNSASKIP